EAVKLAAMRRPRMLRPTIAAALALLCSACVDPERDPRITHTETPTDFSMEFYVTGDPKAQDPLHRPAQFVLEPHLRFPSGRGTVTGQQQFPPLLRSITPEEQESLYALVRDAGLLAHRNVAQTQPDDEATVYEITVMESGRSHRYVVTPEGMPD